MYAFPSRTLTVAALAAAALLSPPALGSGLTVQPGTLMTVDCIAPNSQGPYRLVQYDAGGNVLGLLEIVDPVDIGIPSGLAILGGDVFLSGTENKVAQVDLETGTLFGDFPTQIFGTEDLGTLGNHLIATTWRFDEVKVFDREGNLQDSIMLSPASELTGIDSDGTFLYTSNWNDGDIDVYDLSGNFQYSIPTAVGPHSASGLCYDELTGTIWITTGFGSDLVQRYAMDGTLLDSTPAGLAFLNGIDRSSAELILNAEPNSVTTGDNLEFSIYAGVPGHPVLHVLSSVNGAPTLDPILLGSFAPTGTYEWQVVVPPGLGPLVLGHRAYALDGSGQLVLSPEELVHHH